MQAELARIKDENQRLRGMLTQVTSSYQALQMHLEPWELPPLFTMAKKSSSLLTPSGYWKEKEGELIAVRYGEVVGFPTYKGARRTLQFYLKDGTRGGEGTKTPWFIHVYYQFFVDGEVEDVFLEEDVVLCKVFKRDAADQNSSDPNLNCLDRFSSKKNCLYRFWEAYSGGEQHVPDYTSHELDLLAKNASYDIGLLQQTLTVRNIEAMEESQNVWLNFTKIRTKDDPNEVYAACHRCDKVLTAHPKKHGISHLRRHIRTCSRCCNPSTDVDRQMLDLLRTYKQQQTDGKQLERDEINVNLAQLHPQDLQRTHPTSWYITTSFNRQTQGGQWKEIRKEFTGIRMEQQQMQGRWEDIDKEITVIQMDQLQLQMQVPRPQYMGLRRTLQFQHLDGRKMDWIMHEYQQLDHIESTALFLQGDMVIRKVLHYDKDVIASTFSEFNRWLNSDDDSEEYHYKGERVNTEISASSDYMNGGGGNKRKRSAASKRTSKVWLHFTKIRTADRDVVYAVCHHCDRGYRSARSTNGTSHLWRHKKSCTSKHPGTGNANNGANTAWEAEIWPLFLLFIKNYKETEHQASGMC